jgi:hypothetical protein
MTVELNNITDSQVDRVIVNSKKYQVAVIETENGIIVDVFSFGKDATSPIDTNTYWDDDVELEEEENI